MPPLAGKPPFATDEPDSYYEDDTNGTRRRAAPPKPDNPNKRSSAYDVYDNYLTANSQHARQPSDAPSTTSRNSGVGGIGMGLLAMDSDSDDDDDDDAFNQRRKAEAAKRAADANTNGNNKTAQLAAAINSNAPSPPSSPPPSPKIAAPRPGYAGPTIATLGMKSPSPSVEGHGSMQNPFADQQQQQRSPFANPPQHQQQRGGGIPMPAPIAGIPQPHRQDSGHSVNSGSSHGGYRGPPPGLPSGGPGGGNGNINPPPNAMVRGMSPAPLAPPITPIMPVFAVPKPSTPAPSTHDEKRGIKWDPDASTPTPRKPIMRSNTEDALLPRRGEKGDDFWRRFSMVAHLEEHERKNGGKESMWLRKTRSGSNRLSKWVWFIGLVLLGAIGAAIGLGVYFTKDKPDHQQPQALSGDVGTQRADGVSPVTAGGGGGGSGAGGGFGGGGGGFGGGPGATVTGSVKHVSPTHTIDARAWVEAAVVTPAPVGSAGKFVFERRDGRSRREEDEPAEPEEPCEPEEPVEPKEPEEAKDGEEGEEGEPCPMATATATQPNVKPRMEHQRRGAGRMRRRFV